MMRIVQACRCCILTLIRTIKLASRQWLMVPVMLAITVGFLVFTVGKWLFLPPRYAVFGVDRHPSVMGLLESDILITRLSYDDNERNRDESHETLETVGVFLALTSYQMASQHEAANDMPFCLPAYRYQIFVITSTVSNLFPQTLEDDDDIKTAIHQLRHRCIEGGSPSVIVWQVDVTGSVAPPLVADLVTEAYVDNITWYDVIFLYRLTSPFSLWSRWPPSELKPPSYVGASVIVDDVHTRIAFHRTHLNIFGDSWPHWIQSVTKVATYLKDIYADSSSPSSTLDDTVRESRAWLRRYVDAMEASPQLCLPCRLKREVTSGVNRKIISMSLYGDDPRYTIGALRNAQRLPVVFPDWQLRFYYRHGDVLRHLLVRLGELGAELKDVTAISDVSTLAPMLWRMSVLDDPSVDVVLSRDADSRLTDRDAAAVDAWLLADGRPAFHCMRDHPSHAEFSVNGGLWGARRRRLLDIVRDGPVTPLLATFADRYLDDMRFLDEHIWTPLSTESQHEIYCHDSVSCNRWPGAHPFTTPRRWPGEHVGQVFDAWSRPRHGDVKLLINASHSSTCEQEHSQVI